VKPVEYPVGEDGQPLNETVPILERIEPVDEKFAPALALVSTRQTTDGRYTVAQSYVPD
jgi:hypothetical protein